MDVLLPQSITLDDACGNMVEQMVEYEWLPASCKHCKVFEHSNAKRHKDA